MKGVLIGGYGTLAAIEEIAKLGINEEFTIAAANRLDTLLSMAGMSFSELIELSSTSLFTETSKIVIVYSEEHKRQRRMMHRKKKAQQRNWSKWRKKVAK